MTIRARALVASLSLASIVLASPAQAGVAPWVPIGPNLAAQGTALVDPFDSSHIIYHARFTDHLYTSADAGVTWTRIATPETFYRVAPHPTKQGVWYASANSRVYYSLDAGVSWTMLSGGGTSRYLSLDTERDAVYTFRNSGYRYQINADGSLGPIGATNAVTSVALPTAPGGPSRDRAAPSRIEHIATDTHQSPAVTYVSGAGNSDVYKGTIAEDGTVDWVPLGLFMYANEVGDTPWASYPIVVEEFGQGYFINADGRTASAPSTNDIGNRVFDSRAVGHGVAIQRYGDMFEFSFGDETTVVPAEDPSLREDYFDVISGQYPGPLFVRMISGELFRSTNGGFTRTQVGQGMSDTNELRVYSRGALGVVATANSNGWMRGPKDSGWKRLLWGNSGGDNAVEDRAPHRLWAARYDGVFDMITETKVSAFPFDYSYDGLIAFDPTDSAVIYAAMQVYDPNINAYSVRVLRSSDGGASFSEWIGGIALPRSVAPRELVVSESHVYLKTADGQLRTSPNTESANWALGATGGTGVYCNQLVAHPTDAGRAFCIDGNLLETTNAGQSFDSFANAPSGTPRQVFFSASEPKMMFVRTDTEIVEKDACLNEGFQPTGALLPTGVQVFSAAIGGSHFYLATNQGVYTSDRFQSATPKNQVILPLTGGAVTLSSRYVLSGTTSITLFGAAATVTNVDENAGTVTFTAPPHAVAAATVTMNNGRCSFDFPQSVIYRGPTPTVSSISPTSMLGGTPTKVTVTGTNFSEGALIGIGGKLYAPSALTATSMTAEIGRNDLAGKVDVVVQTADLQQAVLPQAFTITPHPVVESVSPSVVLQTGGTQVTITGRNFDATAVPLIGGIEVSGVERPNANTLRFNAPVLNPAHTTLTVRNPDQQLSDPVDFRINGVARPAAVAKTSTLASPCAQAPVHTFLPLLALALVLRRRKHANAN